MSKVNPKLGKGKYIDGDFVAPIEGGFNLHWNGDFTKTGEEYLAKASKLKPKTREVFDDLIHKEMNRANLLVNPLNGYAMTGEDIERKYNLSPRRRREVMLELKEEGFIAVFIMQNTKQYVINPMIASKAQIIPQEYLHLFASYNIITIGKKVGEKYNLFTQTKVNQDKLKEEYKEMEQEGISMQDFKSELIYQVSIGSEGE